MQTQAIHSPVKTDYRLPSRSPAHRLYSPDQAFLWLPGFEGEKEPYCTFNEFCGSPLAMDFRRMNRFPAVDESGTCFAPPYPVSNETFICWHTNVCPPYPYHPVPILRPLTIREFVFLGSIVMELTGNRLDTSNPTRFLTNRHKAVILVGLAEMELLDTNHQLIGTIPGAALTPWTRSA